MKRDQDYSIPQPVRYEKTLGKIVQQNEEEGGSRPIRECSAWPAKLKTSRGETKKRKGAERRN